MKFFAEALQKLGVLNITVALDTPSNADTAAFVTEGRSEAVLHHDGQTFIIPLPVPSIESQTTTFPPGGQTIELRAAMARDMTQHPRTPLLSAEDVQLRWDNERHISCRACRRLIVVPHSIRWKELPSQSWQEFSDLWHCHSGSSHSHTSCDHELKPTGDLPTLRAFPGTAFVGLMYLVFNFTDVQNVKQTVRSHLSSIHGPKRRRLSALPQEGVDTTVQKKSSGLSHLLEDSPIVFAFLEGMTKSCLSRYLRNDIHPRSRRP